ncbi:hypothetical protein ABER23_17005 [Paenibacillus lautus]|uniref:hypothetical protein n=1 Tax=Paenibacillus lautus TaxID=1401 RepID=UPI003D29A1E6
MSGNVLELLQKLKELYIDVTKGDSLEIYSQRQNEMDALFTLIQGHEIEDNAKPLLQELELLNRLLVQQITFERELLAQERKSFERQKAGVEQYSSSAVQQYESYFIDKRS